MPSPVRVRIADVVSTTRIEIDRANTNQNAYLTRAEGGQLPVELQDNYDAHRNDGHPRVSVKQFREGLGAYIEAQANAVDRNHDGVLTKTDIGRLPRDLRDNFQAVAADAGTPGPLLEQGRAALEAYVSEVLFNSASAEGQRFRTEILGSRTPSAIADLRS